MNSKRTILHISQCLGSNYYAHSMESQQCISADKLNMLLLHILLTGPVSVEWLKLADGLPMVEAAIWCNTSFLNPFLSNTSLNNFDSVIAELLICFALFFSFIQMNDSGYLYNELQTELKAKTVQEY